MKFCVLGEPIPKGRPKLTSFGGHARAYTPARTRMAENHIRSQIVSQLPEGFKPFDCPLNMFINIFKTKPKSTPKKIMLPSKKPDLDNYIKTVMDAMNTVVFVDDALVCGIVATKNFSDSARIEIEVIEWK